MAQKKLEDLMSQNKTTAHFKQDNVIPLTDYADMNKTAFAWTRAFPTVLKIDIFNLKHKFNIIITFL